MSRYLARVFRAFFVSFIGLGGGTSLLLFIWMVVNHAGTSPFQSALRIGLPLGAAIALFLVAVLVPLDIAAKLFLSRGRAREVWDLLQVRTIDFTGSKKDALAFCRQALLMVPYVKHISEDPQSLTIHASIGTSWRSFGERMIVEAIPRADGKWRLRCQSAPLSANIVFDYGKNFENVETWAQCVSEMMSAKTAPGSPP